MSRPKITQLPTAPVSVKTVLAAALEDSDEFETVAIIIKRKNGHYGVRYSATSTEVLCAMAFVFAQEIGEDFRS